MEEEGEEDREEEMWAFRAGKRVQRSPIKGEKRKEWKGGGGTK